MSYFIAHTITFSKDLKTFKAKGGDNNVVPRSNGWTGDIPIEALYYSMDGRMLKLNYNSEKLCFINQLVNGMNYGGNFSDETDYFHIFNSDGTNDPLVNEYFTNFNTEFKNKLIDGLRKLSNKKTHIVVLESPVPFSFGNGGTTSGSYVRTHSKGGCYPTKDIDNAERLSKYKSIHLASKYKNAISEIA